MIKLEKPTLSDGSKITRFTDVDTRPRDLEADCNLLYAMGINERGETVVMVQKDANSLNFVEFPGRTNFKSIYRGNHPTRFHGID